MEPVCPRRRAVNRLHGTPRPEPVAATQSPVAQPKAGDGLEGRRRLLGQLRADPGVPQKAFDADLPVLTASTPAAQALPPPPRAQIPPLLRAPSPERTTPVITSPRRAGRCRKCGHWINSGLEFHLKHCGVSTAQLQAEAVETRRAMCFPDGSVTEPAKAVCKECGKEFRFYPALDGTTAERCYACSANYRSVPPVSEPEPEKTWEDAPPVDGHYYVPVHPEMMEALRDPEPEPVFKPEWLAEPVKRGPARPRKIHD